MESSKEDRGGLGELALVFLRMGATAFGGPSAHIAFMESELVRRRGWLTHERFLDLLGAANLIPGPSSTELAIFIGFERAGWIGLLVAGTCFILPAAFLVGAIAFAYVRFGSLPQIGGVLYGVKPVVIAVIAQALWGLAPKAVKSRVLAAIGVLGCAASALGVNALAVLVGAGLLSMGVRGVGTTKTKGAPVAVWGAIAGGSSIATATASVGLFPLFLAFLKIGAVVFGSGYVLLAFLRADLVERLHWLTEPQLLDAVAVGQVTPGPVFTTATFIGYLLAGSARRHRRDGGDLPPGLRARRRNPPARRARAALAGRERVPRWSERGGAGADGRRERAARAGGDGRCEPWRSRW